MHVAVELPDDIAQQLKTAWQDMPRRVLEAIAVEGYRSGALTRGQVQRLLNLSWWETEAFLEIVYCSSVGSGSISIFFSDGEHPEFHGH
jgi:hypothetical protein